MNAFQEDAHRSIHWPPLEIVLTLPLQGRPPLEVDLPQKEHGARQEVTSYPPSRKNMGPDGKWHHTPSLNLHIGVKTLPSRNFVGGW